jgi:ribosomal protein S18 acetylase RimI-like enzyme
MNDVEIVTYRSELRPEFERLNLLWLEGNSLLEPLDLEYLRGPEQMILAHGGEVFFALRDHAVVGCCAAIPVSPTTFELAKLSVDPSARRLGVGRRLCDTVAAYARDRGAIDLVLTSNALLASAVSLYESLGFQHEPLPANNPYETANVFMRKAL